jgi:DNA-binding transcriptional regulator YiaG
MTVRRAWTPSGISRFRLWNRMTQVNFAKAVGVSRQTINMWEQGKKSVSMDHLSKLDSLAGESEYPERFK